MNKTSLDKSINVIVFDYDYEVITQEVNKALFDHDVKTLRLDYISRAITKEEYLERLEVIQTLYTM
jgi:predicted transcriptional regulator